MSTLAFQTRLDQTLANSNIDAFVRDSKSNPSDRKAHNNLRDSPHEAHSSSISSSPQWSKNTRPPRDSSAEDIRFIKPHHSPVAGKYGSSEAFVTQHQAYHPEEYHQERLPDGLRILVTRDFDVGYFLDLSGLTRPDLIRPRLFARLGINEEHHRNWQLFRYGGSRLKNYPLDDSQVWDLCLKAHQYLLLLISGVSRPLYIPGHIPAPLSHLTRSASRLGKSPDGSSKSHVRQNRSTSDSYTLSSSALNMRAHIDTSPRPMATQNIATPPTRDSKKDLAICDEQVALTLPDLTTQHHPHEHDHALISLRGSEDDLRKSSSSVSSRQSHPNHKPATKASSAIAFIHSAAIQD
ncbi:hypothetical protein DFH28DRAFT_1105421 [Melampsora americana]|nr:hypothetical protein DFH28DRAFT_1105421 [Melampsora americana]